MTQSRHSTTQWLLVIGGLLLVAFNLRPAITSVSPILLTIGDNLGLSSTGEGLLTTLPVLCLGLAAPAAPVLARRLGMERAVMAILLVLILALLIRPYVGISGLFAGTAVAGGCIGVLNVLMPGLVKRDFPNQASLMTGLYTMSLSFGAALAAGATEPLRLSLGHSWRIALAFWFVPALLAMLAWLPQLRSAHQPKVARRKQGRLLRDPLAWQITIFMGLQSSLAYIMFGWLPAILVDRGLSSVTAGFALSVSILIQMGSAVAAPWLGTRMRDQRAIIALVMGFFIVGIGGCLYAPLNSVWLWVVILGIGQGGAFAMALTLLAVRAADAETAGKLSAMAQGFGYVLASMGPLAVGLVHDFFGSWAETGILLGLIGLAALAAGIGAGRDRWVVSGNAD